MRIILATDGSGYSKTAAKYIRWLGFGSDTQVFVLHVVKDYLLPDEVDAARDFTEVSKRGAEALIEDFREELMPTASKITPLLREGEPWREIIEAAADKEADLVVMGHKGLSGMKQFLVGSTMHHVVRHGGTSVLAVRDLPPQDRPMRVLYCTNGTEQCRLARDMLIGLPFVSETEVHVISVVDMEVMTMPEKYYPQEDISHMMAELREHNRRNAEKAVDEDAHALTGRFDKVKKHVVFGIPEEEVLRLAGDISADLIVMGRTERHGISDVLLGSEAYRIVKHATCSVLVGKAC